MAGRPLGRADYFDYLDCGLQFGLALSTMSGRYCADSLSVASTGRPRWRAKSCTCVLPATALSWSSVIGRLVPGPSQDCTWAFSPPFCSAATRPLRSWYGVLAINVLI